MLFRTIEKEELSKFFEILASRNEIIGPVQTGIDRNRKPVYSFGPVTDFQKMKLDHTLTKVPAKRYFLPYKEEMAAFQIEGRDWKKFVNYNCDHPSVMFGLHACDINALNRLDKVLLGNTYPMPYYAVKRKNMFIIGFGCEPQPSCFCRSMSADTVSSGFDMFITDIGPRYFIEIASATAYDLVKMIKTRPPEEADHLQYMRTIDEKNKKFRVRVDTTDLANILDMEFQSDVWKHWGDRCLGCGTCSNVCPTCYCYGVEEIVDIDLRRAHKIKQLYSCNFVDFAEVAGGHNFRPERHTRLKYRYYHKHRGFVEAYEESLCVGCGRCGDACLAGITVPDVIASVRGKENSWNRN